MRRREFLHTIVGAAPVLYAACAGEGGGDPGVVLPAPPSGGFERGTMEGIVDFAGEGNAMLDAPFGAGLDGRLYSDLSTLTADTLITPNDRFYIRTRYPDQLDTNAPWKIRISGHVDAPKELALDELSPLVQPMGVHLLECSGNGGFGRFGLLSAAEWAGIPLAAVLERAGVTERATRVLISGFDMHSQSSERSIAGASWIFTFDDLRDAFLATEMNGEPLPRDHGAPLRLLNPGWYGCTQVKWLDAIELVDEEAPATSQMQEFAARTHQIGVPLLARDYRPARIHVAAMPVRVEKWRVDGALIYRIVGVMWGGTMPTDKLIIRMNPGDSFERVTISPAPATHETWTLWSHPFKPPAPGTYELELNIDDPLIPKQRLDSRYYVRAVEITEI
jgi:DMSO/TMAO reductase YedYZ molybdopterin-dependent catalytic subunit